MESAPKGIPPAKRCQQPPARPPQPPAIRQNRPPCWGFGAGNIVNRPGHFGRFDLAATTAGTSSPFAPATARGLKERLDAAELCRGCGACRVAAQLSRRAFAPGGNIRSFPPPRPFCSRKKPFTSARSAFAIQRCKAFLKSISHSSALTGPPPQNNPRPAEKINREATCPQIIPNSSFLIPNL